MVRMLKNKLQAAIVNSWSEPQGSDHFHLEVALSGGLDSVVLLHALVTLKETINWHVSAVHVNHQLQAVSGDWVNFCERLCERLQIDLRVENVKVEQVAKLGIEAAARMARYQAFSKTSANVVVLAHHSDDQVETALLAFLRGGGLRALAAMPAWRDLNETAQLWRPFLNVSKHDLEQYALEEKLFYVNDPSNSDESYTRNWLRQTVLPQLTVYDEHTNNKILAGIYQRQQELAVLNEIQEQDWEYVFSEKIFSINKMLTLSIPRQEQQLLLFTTHYHLSAWSKVKLNHFLAELAHSPNTRHQILLGCSQVKADRGRLYAWGEKQYGQFKELFNFFDNSFTSERDKCQLGLAFLKKFDNTNNCSSLRKYGISLLPLSKVRLMLDGVALNKLIKVLKARKVPLFIIEEWPCWVLNEGNHQVLAAKIQDGDIRRQFPIWNEYLSFLDLYLIQLNEFIDF